MQNLRHFSCSKCSFAVCSTMGGHIKHFQGHWDKMPRGVRSQWLSCIEWDFSEESESLGITRTQHTQTHHSVNTSCAHSKGDPTQLSLCSGTRGTVITFSWILVIFLQESMELVADFKHAWPLLTLIFIFLSSFRSSLHPLRVVPGSSFFGRGRLLQRTGIWPVCVQPLGRHAGQEKTTNNNGPTYDVWLQIYI